MINVDTNILHAQPDGNPHWYFDGLHCELYFVEKDGQIVRFRLSFENRTIEGVRNHNMRYIEDGHENGKKISAGSAEQLHRFINNIEGLAEGVRAQLNDIVNGHY